MGAKAIAERFVRARRNAGALAHYPGAMPKTLDEAYAIQDAAIALAGDRIIGWKVGRIMPPLDAQFGSNRLAGPIFTAHDADGDNVMPIFTGGFAAAEAEFLLRVGKRPRAGQTDFTLDEAKDLIDAVHIGVEVASSPFPGINDHGPCVTVSDFGNNYGLVIGDAVPDWRSGDFAERMVAAAVNGVEVGSARAAAMPDGPLGAVRFLASLLARRGIALEPGAWISSGAVTGVHPVTVGDEFSATFEGHAPLTCRFSSATA